MGNATVIPNNRIMRFDETNIMVAVFRDPARNINGHAVDGQGRLISCEYQGRGISRTEHDGRVVMLATHFEGKRLNSPNDVVVKSDGSIWFTDPTYGIDSDHEGDAATPEIGASNVYRLDPISGALAAVATDRVKPNGLAFANDERTLYVSDTGATHVPDHSRSITAYQVSADGRSQTHPRPFAVCDAGFFDGFRIDKHDRRGRALLRPGWSSPRHHQGPRTRLQRLLRWPQAQPPVHHRSDIAVRDLFECEWRFVCSRMTLPRPIRRNAGCRLRHRLRLVTADLPLTRRANDGRACGTKW
jgi:streptogramin lyase